MNWVFDTKTGVLLFRISDFSIISLQFLYLHYQFCDIHTPSVSMCWCKISEQRVLTIFGVPFQAKWDSLGYSVNIPCTAHSAQILFAIWSYATDVGAFWKTIINVIHVCYKDAKEMSKSKTMNKNFMSSPAGSVVKTVCSKSFHQCMLTDGVCVLRSIFNFDIHE